MHQTFDPIRLTVRMDVLNGCVRGAHSARREQDVRLIRVAGRWKQVTGQWDRSDPHQRNSCRSAGSAVLMLLRVRRAVPRVPHAPDPAGGAPRGGDCGDARGAGRRSASGTIRPPLTARDADATGGTADGEPVVPDGGSNDRRSVRVVHGDRDKVEDQQRWCR